jgi:hypothetical protein
MHDRIAAVDPCYGFPDSCFPALLKQENHWWSSLAVPLNLPGVVSALLSASFPRLQLKSQRVTIEMLEYFLYPL